MNFRIEQGDYVLVEIAEKGKQKHLVKVGSTHKKGFSGVLAKDVHIPNRRVVADFETSQVVLNLGKNPPAGKVYGVDTSMLYKGKKVHDHFGDIHFFYKPKPEIGSALMKSFDKAYVQLKKRGLDFLLDDLLWEIVPPNGEKYAGMYTRLKPAKSSEAPPKFPPRILIRPELMPATEFPYCIYHELGHHLHLEFCKSKKLNAHWIRLFNTSIKGLTVKKDESSRLLERLLEQEDPPSAFKGQLDEDDALAYKCILRTISACHGISVNELDILFESDLKDDIRQLWPLRTISQKDFAPVISLYACKNYKETLAETFAFYMTGKKLPQSVMKLMERTISYAKTQRNKTDD